MDYEKKYKELVEAVKMLKETNPSDIGIQNWVKDNVTELGESEDERIRKDLLDFCKTASTGQTSILIKDKNQWFDWIAWLERQDEKDKLNTMLDDSLSLETKESWNKFLDEKKPVKIDEGQAKMMFIWALEKVEERTNKGYKLTDCDKNSWWNDFKTYALSGNKGEQTPAWSEEDERILRTIISDGIRGAEFDMVQVDWLKSLKERITWKPSDEQIKTLWDAICNLNHDGYKWVNDLKSLYQDLNKLKEE